MAAESPTARGSVTACWSRAPGRPHGTQAWADGSPRTFRVLEARGLFRPRSRRGCPSRPHGWKRPIWWSAWTVAIARRSPVWARGVGDDRHEDRLVLLRSFDSRAGGSVDVPDPYNGDEIDFETCLDMVEAGCRGLSRAPCEVVRRNRLSKSRRSLLSVVGATRRLPMCAAPSWRTSPTGARSGAAVCVIVDGGRCVDLAGGWGDADADPPWQPDTLVDFYSVGKAFLAPSSPCNSSTPGSSGSTTPSHPSGRSSQPAGRRRRPCATRSATGRVPAIREPLTNDDLWEWERMAGALAATEAWWEPGTRHAYHTNTYGHLVGEVVRRVSGERRARRGCARLAGPLGADVHVGVPAGERPLRATWSWQRRRRRAVWTSPRSERRRAHGDARATSIRRDTRPWAWSTRPSGAPRRSRRPTATDGPRRGPDVRRAPPARPRSSRDLLAEATSPQSEGYCPILARGGHLRPRFQADRAAAPLRAEPGQLRPLRDRRRGGFRRP